MNKVLLILTLLSVNICIYPQSIYPTFRDGKIYIKFKDNAGLKINVDEKSEVTINEVPLLQNLSSKYNLTKLTRPFNSNKDEKLLTIYKLEFKNYELVDELINDLKKLDEIEIAEKVPLMKLSYVPNDTLYKSTAGGFNWKWWLDEVNAQKAWDITKGDTNILVGIADIGLYTGHPDLQGQIKKAYDFADNDNNVNPPSGLTQTEQYNWSHGTHISGIIAAVQDNHIGITGIAPHVKLAFAKATPDTSVSGDYIDYGYEGVNWLAQQGVKVINMSWSTYDSSAVESMFLNSIYNQGIVLVAAAGNDGRSIKNYPAAFQHVIGVASTDDKDHFSSFSTYGSWVKISAPGGTSGTRRNKIYLLSTTFSTDFYAARYFPNQKYDIMEGTSMASPVISGICGLLFSIKPDITPDQILTCLKTTARDLDTLNPNYKGMMGAGRVDAYKALLCVQKLPVITANFTSDKTIIQVGQTVNFTDKTTGNPTSWTWTFDHGNPPSSNQKNPSVVYSKAGTYYVTLTAKKDTSVSTITKTNYITVYDTLAVDACDTLRLPKTVPDTVYEGPGTTGYYTGNNTYGFQDLAEYFSSYEYMQANTIRGAKVVVGMAKGYDTSKVTLAIWTDLGGKPIGSPTGSPIATKTIPYTALTDYNNLSNPSFTQIIFDTPVVIPGPFYMGIVLPSFKGDTIALASSNLNLPCTAWEYTTAGGWQTFQSVFSGQLNVRLAIYPIVCNIANHINELQTPNPNLITIYPNPANSFIVVNCSLIENSRVTISIFDLTGRRILSCNLEINSPSTTIKLDVNGLAKGIYFIELLNSNGAKASAKFVKN